MEDCFITSKMNEYMFRLNQKMGEWLSKKLPYIEQNWWQELVVDNLSDMQRNKVYDNNISEISGLDLAALLRVVDRNWFIITR